MHTRMMVNEPLTRRLLDLMIAQSTVNDILKDEIEERYQYVKDLLIYAYKNKILLTFLEMSALKQKMVALYGRLIRQRNAFDNSLIKIIDILNRMNIDYAYFKVRPLFDAPVDIDILIPSEIEAKRVLKAFKKAFNNVIIWERNIYSIGMRICFDSHYEVVEIYIMPHVSDLVYIDGTRLMSFTEEININGYTIRVLRPEAEAVMLLAHAICKEQLITLSDVISIVFYYLLSDKSKFYSLLNELLNDLYLHIFMNAVRGGSMFPVHIPLSIATFLIGILIAKSAVTKRSIPSMLLTILNKRRFLRDLLDHVLRESYVRGLEH